jgi:hypothetical protein
MCIKYICTIHDRNLVLPTYLHTCQVKSCVFACVAIFIHKECIHTLLLAISCQVLRRRKVLDLKLNALLSLTTPYQPINLLIFATFFSFSSRYDTNSILCTSFRNNAASCWSWMLKPFKTNHYQNKLFVAFLYRTKQYTKVDLISGSLISGIYTCC